MEQVSGWITVGFPKRLAFRSHYLYVANSYGQFQRVHLDFLFVVYHADRASQG